MHRLPRIDLRRFRTISYLAILSGFLLLRLRSFDIVHVHLANAQADVAVAAARLLARGSYVKLAAGGPLGEIGRFRRVARITRYYGIKKADMVQAISKEIARDLTRIGVQSQRIRAIPNGVRLPEIASEERLASRARLGIAERELLVLNTGRLEREKGAGDLLRAWRSSTPPEGRLIIIGSAGIKDPVDITDLPPSVEVRGWTSEVAMFLSAADIFVLPSHAEGMSNALLEAMAAGLPCIATRVGAAPEMIRHKETGLLVAPGDDVALTEAMNCLARDPALRRQIGQRARSSVAAQYGIESVVERILAAYREIAAQ